MTSTIPLAKGLDLGKLTFPVFVSQKHDGVPIRIDLDANEQGVWCGVQSRSGKEVPSVADAVERFVTALQKAGVRIRPMTFVAEVTHTKYTDFKDVSGVVRKKTPQDDLVLNFFDFALQMERDNPFSVRTQQLCNIISNLFDPRGEFKYVQQVKMTRPEDFQKFIEKEVPPGVEGWIVRSHEAGFKPNSRHWDYQKIVKDPTVDLRIVGFEEAHSEAGAPLGMVGRLIADYKGERIGVGPGKLTHEERRQLWELIGDGPVYEEINGPNHPLACIKYKRDDSYKALRQPTFQHWREDKQEVSYE